MAGGAFSADGKSVVTASDDKTARVWDAATGEPRTPPLVHGATVKGAQWSNDGRYLHTLTTNDQVQVWDLATGDPLTPPRRAVRPEMTGTRAPTGTPEELPTDERPVEDLLRLAHMFAVGQIDSGGNLVPLHVEELTEASPIYEWNKLFGSSVTR